MLALERRNSILVKLKKEKKVTVNELSQLYCVTEETIRRDLEKLHNEGLVIKSYGGAILNEGPGIELPSNVRKKTNVAEKQIIADIVVDLIENGEHIFLDASSSAIFIAKALKKKKRHLSVVTNSVEILIELSDMPDWDVISTGGKLSGGYLALTDSGALRSISEFYAEKAVISCRGLHMEKGITDSKEEFARYKQAMIKSADKVILAVDSSKFDLRNFSKIEDINIVDIAVTDKSPGQAWLDYFAQNNIECLYPQ